MKKALSDATSAGATVYSFRLRCSPKSLRKTLSSARVVNLERRIKPEFRCGYLCCGPIRFPLKPHDAMALAWGIHFTVMSGTKKSSSSCFECGLSFTSDGETLLFRGLGRPLTTVEVAELVNQLHAWGLSQEAGKP